MIVSVVSAVVSAVASAVLAVLTMLGGMVTPDSAPPTEIPGVFRADASIATTHVQSGGYRIELPSEWECERQNPGAGDHDVYLDGVGHPVIDPSRDSIERNHLTYYTSCIEGN